MAYLTASLADLDLQIETIDGVQMIVGTPNALRSLSNRLEIEVMGHELDVEATELTEASGALNQLARA